MMLHTIKSEWSIVYIVRSQVIISTKSCTVKTGHPQKDQKLVFNTNYRLMQVKSITECSRGEHPAILLTCFKLPFSIKEL